MDVFYEYPTKTQSETAIASSNSTTSSSESKASVGCVSTTTSRVRVTPSKQQQLLYNFQLIYEYLCKGNNTTILKKITSQLSKRKLDFVADRIKLENWSCILEALRMDRTLHVIAVRSRYQNKLILESVGDEVKARKVASVPVLYTKHIFQSLIASLRETLESTKALTCLELEGLPLTTEYLSYVMEGVAKCRSLQNLSLYCSAIGDEGVEMMCPALKSLPNIVFLDLTGCGVTQKGAIILADLIKYQNLERCGEGWKQNLRYRTVNIDEFPGLRRLTLNHNPLIGDVGFSGIMENLKDDIWIKALDAQDCGLSNYAASCVMETLETNTSLRVVDVRSNDKIYSDQLLIILHALARNDESVTRFNDPWLNLDTNIRPKQMSTRPSTSQSRPHVTSDVGRRVRQSDVRRADVVDMMDKFGKNLDELLVELEEERIRFVKAQDSQLSVQDKLAAALSNYQEERAKRISAETELNTLLLMKEKVMRETETLKRNTKYEQCGEVEAKISPRPAVLKHQDQDSVKLKPWSYTVHMDRVQDQEDLSKLQPWSSKERDFPGMDAVLTKRASSLSGDVHQDQDSVKLKPWTYTVHMDRVADQEDIPKLQPWSSKERDFPGMEAGDACHDPVLCFVQSK